jgi:prolyl-tRNA synthetase
VTGGLEKDIHLTNVEIGRDFAEPEWGRFPQRSFGRRLSQVRQSPQSRPGNRSGPNFKLGTEIFTTHALRLSGTNTAKIKEAVMGCYGIGVTRTVGATIEQHNDADGIIWPISTAPYQVHLLLLLNPAEPEVAKVADQYYEDLKQAGYEVLYDDRPKLPPGLSLRTRIF